MSFQGLQRATARVSSVGGLRLLGSARDADQHDEEMGARTPSRCESPFKNNPFHPSTLSTAFLLGRLFTHSIKTNECDGFNKLLTRYSFCGLMH